MMHADNQYRKPCPQRKDTAKGLWRWVSHTAEFKFCWDLEWFMVEPGRTDMLE